MEEKEAMNLMQTIARKLGAFTQRKAGAEYLFGCPKCHHPKLEVNPGKKLFHCFRCGYKGNMGQLLKDLSIHPESLISKDLLRPIIQTQLNDQVEYKIPKYKPVITMEAERYLQTRKVSDEFRGGYSEDPSLRGRLIIPIIENGMPVCFIARAIDKSQPKELSGPNRSWFLYGIDTVKKDEPVVLVEGIFDAEAVSRAGFNAVAIMGSNISDTQIGKLLAKNPYPILLMFDGDRAGAEGTVKAYRKLLKRTHTPIKDVSLTDDIDPDEIPTEQLGELLRGAWRSA